MLLVNSSWLKPGKRITILKGDKLNYNGKVYPYTLKGDRVQFLEWGNDNREVVEKGRLCGWEEELPLFNPYYMLEWQKFLFMFFRHQYQGDDNIEKGELDTPNWKEWKEHYLNENDCVLKSPRDRTSLRLSRSPTASPISSPSSSPRGSIVMKNSPLRFASEGSNTHKKGDWTRSSPDLTTHLSQH